MEAVENLPHEIEVKALLFGGSEGLSGGAGLVANAGTRAGLVANAGTGAGAIGASGGVGLVASAGTGARG